MTPQTFHMSGTIDAVDPMVIALRSAVEEVIADATRFRFELCITEALANLVTHTPSIGADTSIKIVLNKTAGHVVIEIFDPAGAAAFDLRNHATDLSQVDAMAESGRGLGLILECADDVSYGPSEDHNSLSLTFRDHGQDTSQPSNGAST